MGKTIRIGTRGSKLALAQAALVANALKATHRRLVVDLMTITTRGDTDRSTPISSLGIGVFVKEIENALLDGRIDVAVHSAKDLPSRLPNDFVIAAYPERGDPRDVFVSKHTGGLAGLPAGARIATGSTRRRALLISLRKDLEIVPVRGNVDTRIAKLNDPARAFDALVLAAAGLNRLGYSNVSAEPFDPGVFVPAPGQGALAVQTLRDNHSMIEILASIDHLPTRQAMEAETAVLRTMGSGCSAPVGAFATVSGDVLELRAFASDPEARRPARHFETGPARDAVGIGQRTAWALMAGAGLEIGAMGTIGQPPGSNDD